MMSASICSKLCGNGIFEDSEECDDGNSEKGDGCHDCLIEDNFLCDKSSPSICLSNTQELLQAQQNTQFAKNTQTASTVISSVSTSLLFITQLSQIGTLGPTYFLMLHMYQLLRVMSLIGHHQNSYLIKFI